MKILVPEYHARMDPLEHAFRNLDRWRHLPSYQLERRADVFFSAYMRDVVEKHVGVPLQETVIPEFPLKRDLIWPDTPTGKSVKVDYVLFAQDYSLVYFVELKTDLASRRAEQDEYLWTGKDVGFRKIVEGIREIMLATKEYRKYFHLAHALSEAGFLSLPEDLRGYVFPAPRRGLTDRLEAIRVGPHDPTIEVIYLQPKRDEIAEEEGGTERKPDYIDFEEFASHLDGLDDPLSRSFRDCLRKWVSEAGSEEPG